MGENICKLCEWQEVNIKKIQTAHNQYRRKKKNKTFCCCCGESSVSLSVLASSISLPLWRKKVSKLKAKGHKRIYT